MNYFKLLTIFLLSFTMIACSSDEDFNTQEATVEFQSAEIEVKELTSILNLPIVVKGERNGLIKVHVILKENNSGFESEKAILITEDHLSIPMRTESVNVETLLHLQSLLKKSDSALFAHWLLKEGFPHLLILFASEWIGGLPL